MKSNPHNLNKNNGAFTLLELLVVMSTIALLTGILVPALAAARRHAGQVLCSSNVRQLVLANTGYAGENDDFYVPAAGDMWQNGGGLHRWHGVRNSLAEPFDPHKGPLAPYLADGRVKECPRKVNFLKGYRWSVNFEQGCGGYGYNMLYLGSRLWQGGISTMEQWKDAYAQTARISEVASPCRTLMFADTAMAIMHQGKAAYIEYSFAEPPFTVYNGRTYAGLYLSPSLHFRHSRRAAIGWADAHISFEAMASTDAINAYLVGSAGMMLGWFEPVDNSAFDLR